MSCTICTEACIIDLCLHDVTEGITKKIVYGFIKQQKVGITSFKVF